MTPKQKRQDYNLRNRYGITLAQYKKIHKSQRGRCAICNRHQRHFKKKFSVDHNHKTGKIRGLLCHYCNSKLLRYLRDDKNKAEGLVKYLTRALNNDTEWTVEGG